MTKYLVTGAAGFIGANFVKYLIGKYDDEVDIVVLDALTYAGNLMALKDELAAGQVKFIHGDIADEKLVAEVFEKEYPDYVVNFAAETHVDRSITHPRLFAVTNVIGTQCLLENSRKAWLTGHDENGKPIYKPGKKFLQISTDEVYGSLNRDYPEGQPLELDDNLKKLTSNRGKIQTFGKSFFTEGTPLSPRSPYSAAKTSADLFVMAYNSTYGLPVNITRCSNNYGPLQFPEKLIPLIIGNILAGRRLPVYGKGDNVRDWLYVTDHAKAVDLVLRKGKPGEIYNVGGFNEEQNINIVRLIIDIIARIMKEEPEYRRLLAKPQAKIDYSIIDFVTDRPGHDKRYAIDPTKIATELGWYPETPFNEGIEKTIRWYLDNREWVDSVSSGEYLSYYEKMYGNRQSTKRL